MLCLYEPVWFVPMHVHLQLQQLYIDVCGCTRTEPHGGNVERFVPLLYKARAEEGSTLGSGFWRGCGVRVTPNRAHC